MRTTRHLLKTAGNWLPGLQPAGCLLVIVFSLLGIRCSLDSIALSELDATSATSSIAPGNLRRAAESFRVSLAAESPMFDSSTLTESQSWQKLEESLSGYADRLALHQSQSRRLHVIITCSGLAGSILMLLGFSVGMRFTRRNQPNSTPSNTGGSAG